MKKVWFLRALKIIKDNVIMKKHNALKLTMFFLGISLAMVLYFVGLSNAQLIPSYMGPFSYVDESGNLCGTDGGYGFGSFVYPTDHGFESVYFPPNSYYGPYGGFGYGYPTYGYNGYQQSYNPYGYQSSYNPYGYQQSYNPYSYQQAYNPYGYQQPFNPYGYQQSYNPYLVSSPFSNYPGYGFTINLYRNNIPGTIWTSPTSGYNPFLNRGFSS